MAEAKEKLKTINKMAKKLNASVTDDEKNENCSNKCGKAEIKVCIAFINMYFFAY